MHRKLIGHRRLAAASFGIALSAAWPIAHGAAQTVKFNIDPGLWETTTNMNPEQVKAMMEQQLDQVPADKRPQMEAMMGPIMKSMSKPRTMKQCITPERIKDGFKLPDREQGNCTRTMVSNTATEMRMRMECHGPHPRTVNVHVQALDPHTMHGTTDMESTEGMHTATLNSTIDGKWLGADCAGISPDHPKME